MIFNILQLQCSPEVGLIVTYVNTALVSPWTKFIFIIVDFYILLLCEFSSGVLEFNDVAYSLVILTLHVF